MLDESVAPPHALEHVDLEKTQARLCMADPAPHCPSRPEADAEHFLGSPSSPQKAASRCCHSAPILVEGCFTRLSSLLQVFPSLLRRRCSAQRGFLEVFEPPSIPPANSPADPACPPLGTGSSLPPEVALLNLTQSSRWERFSFFF